MRWISGVFLIVFLLGAADRFFPLPLDRLKPFSAVMVDGQGQMLCALLAPDERWRFPVSPAQVSPRYLTFLTAYEDKRFHTHWGVDFLSSLRAAWQWMRTGHVVSGASTLTMQTARLLEPRPRTLVHKWIQMARAFQLEWHFSKQEILSFYLTLAPFGGNIEGIEAAALFYFQKSARHLTDEEAALLVALPQAPTALRPDKNPGAALRARNKVLSRLVAAGVLTPSRGQALAAASLGVSVIKRPQMARHLLQDLVTKNPHTPLFRTTLDAPLQQQMEALLAREVETFEPHATAAALVVNHRTGHVVAYGGSALFHSPQRQGQVNMVRAVRSPGSALKPSIYALAFDQGFLHPESLMADTATSFQGYRPTNFHDTWHGVVRVRDALQQSLNVPAVAVLEKMGPGHFVATLEAAGIPFVLKKGHLFPTLPVALGGVGLTLYDLVALYTAFSNAGTVVQPTVLTHEKPEKKKLFSPVSAWYITQILEDSPPPAHFLSWQCTRQQPIAYKTGTSYGYRDGWAVGYAGDYTIGVWVGRADGAPCLNLTGHKAAAPLLFKIFSLLPPVDQGAARQPPEGALQVTHAQLPEGLKFFVPPSAQKGFSISPETHHQTLAISFPLPGSRIQKPAHGKPLVFSATGGVRPLKWMVNGRFIPSSSFSSSALWVPDGAGFSTITVIDGTGHSASLDVELF